MPIGVPQPTLSVAAIARRIGSDGVQMLLQQSQIEALTAQVAEQAATIAELQATPPEAPPPADAAP